MSLSVEINCWDYLRNCWDYLRKSAVEIMCWYHLLRLSVEICCWDHLLTPTVEIICWVHLLRSAVEIICSFVVIICLDQLFKLSAETNCWDSLLRSAVGVICCNQLLRYLLSLSVESAVEILCSLADYTYLDHMLSFSIEIKTSKPNTHDKRNTSAGKPKRSVEPLFPSFRKPLQGGRNWICKSYCSRSFSNLLISIR